MVNPIRQGKIGGDINHPYTHGFIFERLAAFFYANEGTEPIHIHIQRGEKDGKYWLDIENYEIREAYTYSFSVRDSRDVQKIIFQNFDDIVDAWEIFQGGRK